MKAKIAVSGANVFPLSRQIGQRISQHRRQTGCSATILAEALGINDTELNDLECGVKQISLDQLQIVATELGVPIAHFFPDDSGHTDAAIQALLDEFPDVQDALRLLRAFTNIGDKNLRASLIVKAEEAARS